MDIIKEINLLPEIISTEKVVLDKELQVLLGKSAAKARGNNRHVSIFSIRYCSNGHKVAGFFLIPKKISNGRTPAIIYNRGGTKDYGLIKRGMMFTELADIAREGYIVIGSQYSGNILSEGSDERGGAEVNDIMVLIKILQKLSFVDKNRIHMYGTSRGGMMTYRILASTSIIKSAVVVAGEADLVRAVKWRPEMREVFVECFGGGQKALRERSAAYWPEKFSKTPLLLIHGTKDEKVNHLDSVRLAKELTAHGIPNKLILLEGGDHALTNFEKEVKTLTLEWLKNGHEKRKHR